MTQPLNPCKKKVVFAVEYGDLNDYIASCLGIGSFEGTLESPNDSTHEYAVTAEPDAMAEWNEPELAKIIARGNCEEWRLNIVLNHLCRKGLLEPGDYVVSVSW